MVKPADGTLTTINVKNVDKTAWEAAMRAAILRGEAAGPWLNRAIRAQLNAEAGGREFPPEPVKNGVVAANQVPEGMSLGEVTAAINAFAALAAATGQKPAAKDISRAYGYVDEVVRRARGHDPRPDRSFRRGTLRALPAPEA